MPYVPCLRLKERLKHGASRSTVADTAVYSATGPDVRSVDVVPAFLPRQTRLQIKIVREGYGWMDRQNSQGNHGEPRLRVAGLSCCFQHHHAHLCYSSMEPISCFRLRRCLLVYQALLHAISDPFRVEIQFDAENGR
jgi:hypothetical protein